MRDLVVRDVWVSKATIKFADGVETPVTYFERMTETRYRNAVSRAFDNDNFIIANFECVKEKRSCTLGEFYSVSKPVEQEN
jgi:hypothetical protein